MGLRKCQNNLLLKKWSIDNDKDNDKFNDKFNGNVMWKVSSEYVCDYVCDCRDMQWVMRRYRADTMSSMEQMVVSSCEGANGSEQQGATAIVWRVRARDVIDG